MWPVTNHAEMREEIVVEMLGMTQLHEWCFDPRRRVSVCPNLNFDRTRRVKGLVVSSRRFLVVFDSNPPSGVYSEKAMDVCAVGRLLPGVFLIF